MARVAAETESPLRVEEPLAKLISCGDWEAAGPKLKQLTKDQILQVVDEHGFTAAHHAAKDGAVEVLRYLIEEKNVDVDVKDDSGSTPLYRAVGFGQQECIRYLKGKNASLTHINNNGDSLLHNSAYAADEEVSTMLIETGSCDPFLPDVFKDIPLFNLIDKIPETAAVALNAKVTLCARHVQNRLWKFDLTGLDYGNDIKGVVSPIGHLVDGEKIDLLKHPLIEAYFQLRWDAFAKRVLGFQILEYVIDLAIISFFAYAFEHHTSELAREREDDEYEGPKAVWGTSAWILCGLVFLINCKGIWQECWQLAESKRVLIKMPYLAYLTRQRSPYFTMSRYWNNGFNYMDLTAYFCGLAVCVVLATGGPGAFGQYRRVETAKRLLAIALLFFWSKFLKLLGTFQSTGPAVRTIIRMVSDLSTFFSFYILFWISFSLAFYIQYGEQMGSLWQVALTVLEITVLGDGGQIAELVRGREGDVIAQILYVFMLLLLPLMLCNLLIAMMGNSYAIVQYRALDEWRVIWVNFILEAEDGMQPEKVKQLIAKTARANFEAVPLENQTAFDMALLREQSVFNDVTSYKWVNGALLDEEDKSVSLIILRTELLEAIKHTQHQIHDLQKLVETQGVHLNSQDDYLASKRRSTYGKNYRLSSDPPLPDDST